MTPGSIGNTAAGLAFLGLASGAAGGISVEASTAGLSSPVRMGSTAQVTSGTDGSALLMAPPGAAVIAIVAGAVARDGASVRIDGDGDDAGVTVTYTSLDNVTTAARVARGDDVGRVATLGDRPPGGGALVGETRPTVSVTIRVDDHVIDASPLLRAALDDREEGTSSSTMVHPVLRAVVTQEFGCTAYAFEPVDPSCPGGHFHSGIDLAAPSGTPVQAALGGAVHVIDSTTGYGLHVMIDAGGGVVTLYAHLASVFVADGDQVSTGGVIGTVGSTGNSTGPHLHFEVRRHSIAEDPRPDVTLP
jgi:hypothetical protein